RLVFFVREGHIVEFEDGLGNVIGKRQWLYLRGVELWFINPAGGIDKCLIDAGFHVVFHDLYALTRHAHRALGGIDHPAHHEHWLLSHGDHLNEHDHVTDGEMTLEGAPENNGVDAEENHGHRQAAEGIHRVPPARLRACGGDIFAVMLGEDIKLTDLGDERLCNLHLA